MAFDRTIDTGRGESSNNFFLDETVIPERGKRSGFLAFYMSDKDIEAVLDPKAGELDIHFQDVEGHAYIIEFPPAQVRATR